MITENQTQPSLALLITAAAMLIGCSCAMHNQPYSYCTPVNTTEGVQLPNIPISYQTRIEMNIVTKNKTMEIEEYLDGDTGNMRIKIFQKNGELDDYIFNNSTREIFAIINNIECVVVNMSTTDLDLLIGINGKMVGSSRQILRFAKEFGMEYRNRTEVRGIAVDHWFSCQKWPERKAEFTVDWYFSAKDWNTPYDRNLPVRADVKGQAGTIGGAVRDFHIIYDFMFFRNTLMVDTDIFDTPDGVYCENRKHVKPPPDLPAVMSYSQELLVYAPDLEVAQYANVHYDGEQFLVKYQFRDQNSQSQAPFYNLGSMTVVQDFKTGVAYYVDDLIGNCTDRPIGAGLFDVDDPAIKGKPGWYIVELRSPMDLFRIDESYQFTGKRNSRGVPIDRYISLRHDYPIQGWRDLNFTFEYQMLDPDVTELVLGKNKINTGKNVPIQLRISNYKKLTDIIDPTFDYREVYNFYNFDTQMAQKPSEDFDRIQPYDLDVTSCYAKEERKNILIRFRNGDVYDTYVKDAQSIFIRRAIETLMKSNLGLVNPLRFQRVRLDYSAQSIYLIFTLLDGPHPYAQFQRLNGRDRYVESADLAMNAGSELECLQQCNKVTSVKCNSIAYCPNSKTGSNCLLSESFNRNVTNPDASHQCSVLIRPVSVLRPDSLELSLEDAFSLLVDFVETGSFFVSMERPQQDGGSGLPDKYNVTAFDIEQFEIRPNVDQALTGRHLFKFNAIPNAGLKKIDRRLSGTLSAEDCADACLTSIDVNCKSFTYCYGLGNCLLHQNSPTEQPDLIEQRQRCNLYDKNELSSFTKEPGVSRVESATHKFTLVDTELKCARTCLSISSSSSSAPCRSFDYCDLGAEQKKFCYTSSSHKLDPGSEVSVKINCTHYSKSYTGDFQTEFGVTDPNLSDYAAKIRDLTLDQCSRSCAENYGERCNGFYYCSPKLSQKSLCAIREPGVQLVTQGNQDGLLCYYYSRSYDLDGNVWTQRNTNIIANGASGVSVLNVLTVSGAMLLIGSLLGVALVFAFIRWRSPPLRLEEPQVQFSK